MERLRITAQVSIPLDEIEIGFVRSQGAGGQNVNKLATAAHLRFAIAGSSLPEFYKERLLAFSDQRISSDGVIVIKAQRFRSQEKNREDALDRLRDLIQDAVVQLKPRKATRPTLGARKKRLESKVKHGELKRLRGKVGE